MAAREPQGLARGGFTLIEVMATLLLIAVLVLGVWGLQGALARMNGFSHGLTHATAFAQDKCEELLSLSPGSVASGFDATGTFSRVWTVSAGPVPGTRKLDIQVLWQRSPGQTNTIRLISLRN